MKTKELKEKIEALFNVRIKYNKVIINNSILKIIPGIYLKNIPDRLNVVTNKISAHVDVAKITTIDFDKVQNMLLINGVLAIKYE